VEIIYERLTHLADLIGSIKEDEDYSINDRLKEAIKSVKRAESLYIDLAV
jgi:hypothetical protein